MPWKYLTNILGYAASVVVTWLSITDAVLKFSRDRTQSSVLGQICFLKMLFLCTSCGISVAGPSSTPRSSIRMRERSPGSLCILLNEEERKKEDIDGNKIWKRMGFSSKPRKEYLPYLSINLKKDKRKVHRSVGTKVYQQKKNGVGRTDLLVYSIDLAVSACFIQHYRYFLDIIRE